MASAFSGVHDAYELVQFYTKSTPARLSAMFDALNAIEETKVPGDIVECGVWRGGNIMLATVMCPERTCWLYDTFDGMTVPDEVLDVKRSGERAIDRYNAKLAGGTKWDAVSVGEVLKAFDDLHIDTDRLKFSIGPVENTVHGDGPDVISILRLDVDWYSPTKVALEVLYPRLSVGGFLIVDDYGHWMGARKAVDDYFGENVPPWTDADYTCRVFRKC